MSLRRDLRAAVPDASLGLLVTASVFVFFYFRVQSGASDTVAVMPFLADAGKYWMYWLCQAFGWAGLLWAWLTIVLGLLVSGPRPGWLRMPVSTVERLHRTTSLSAIGLMFAHAVLFFAEIIRDDSDSAAVPRVWGAFVETFVPGGYPSGTGRWAILIGQAALYLAVPLGLAFYFRHRLGSRTWRNLHRFIIVVYVLSVWHTLLYGTNVWYDGWPRTVLWALQLPILLLIGLRLLKPARRSERLTFGGPRSGLLPPLVRLAGRVVVALAIAGIIAVMVTGRDGGRTRPAPEPPAATQSAG